MSQNINKTIKPNELEVVLATDCGSTTTKARLFEKCSDGWRATFSGEAPTTVEKPVADVTIGARNAFLELEEVSGRKILADNESNTPFIYRNKSDPKNGIDLYVSTSSAGGGLQMIVAGIVSSMSAESAERAALGAGAIVMDTIAVDDGREAHERIAKIRHLRPDIVLIAGGVEGGNTEHPLELAETVLQANPRPRFGDTLRLPIIYAANSKAVEDAREILAELFEFVVVDNIRPSLEEENLPPARDAIHELFLNHVMSHAPGYAKLLTWTPVGIQPTPGAFGDMIVAAAEQLNKQILSVDIGGATTDVFSVVNPDLEQKKIFNRTVSANLGMSYSVANVLVEAGVEAIGRWLPFSLSVDEIQDRLRNKMIRPTTIPSALDDLLLEQAVCREALRLAFIHHKRLAVGLKGVKRGLNVGNIFKQERVDSLISMLGLDLIIGSGGVLSHAPNRNSAALMLIDAYEPEGVTELAVDSIFMIPHLGVFAQVHPQAATEILLKDCLVRLGTVIAPAGYLKANAPLFEVQGLTAEKIIIRQGELKTFPLAEGKQAQISIKPLANKLNVGAGYGKVLQATVTGGSAGVILDGRGRPLQIPNTESARLNWVKQTYNALKIET